MFELQEFLFLLTSGDYSQSAVSFDFLKVSMQLH